MDAWKFQVRIISLQNFITCCLRSQRWTPVIFEFGASPVKSWRNWKIDFLFQTSDQKTDFSSLIFSEIHDFKKKFFFVLEKFGKKNFFLYGTVTFNGISRFSIFDEVWGRFFFSVKSWETKQLYHAKDHGSCFPLLFSDLNFVKNWGC